MKTTLGVTLETMIGHGRAVANACSTACVVVDMPFGSYQESKEQAYRNAARVLAETGCDAVKLEGGTEMAETVEFMIKRGVPVMGHIGLQPQSVNTVGGFRVQGKNQAAEDKILEDAKSLEEAGVFSMVIECVIGDVADSITKKIAVPTIGIGASHKCDGQILVTEDLLGLSSRKPPKFVKQYANLASDIEAAIKQYASEVTAEEFPAEEHCYSAD